MRTRRMANPERKAPEHEEQAALIEWTEYNLNRFPELEYLYAVPNGARTSRSQAVKLKREGMKAGVPDLCLPVPRGPYHSLYIEMKAEDGRPSVEQKRWLAFLNKHGIKAVICYGWLEAKDVIEQYLEQP
jgi:hypothetical protein